MITGVIDGGKGGEPPKKPFHPHWLSEYLWRAIYPRHAYNMEQIRTRIQKLVKTPISPAQADDVMNHVRSHCYDYNWTVEHVQKGAVGEMRMYFPILLDKDDPDFYVMDDDKYQAYMRYGAYSSVRTIASMAAHEAAAMAAYADTTPDMPPRQRKEFRAFSGMMDAASRMAVEAAARLAGGS